MPRRKLENRTIEVILLEANKHLGEKYESVRVKPIYARNVLLPKNIAVLATADMVNKYAQKIEAATKERKVRAEGFQGLLSSIQKDGGISFTGKVNKEGTLYAKIDESDITKLIKETYKADVEEHFFKLKKKIVAIGNYSVPFMYKELKGDIAIKVIAENPEVIEKKFKVKLVEEVEEGTEESKEETKEEKKAE
ncbi:MAG: 50S ribosomal protein L9 [Spirochaetaceae bacterium 4572_7]|nr:MAG: 50S ribosomal protein L9 [Spirochaetaceae bacterium 4572_7]